jgi:polysaccharide export outer membrane protein
VDLRGLLTLGNVALDIEIRDGDNVFVAAAPKFSISGEVRRPGDYRIEKGMSALRALNLAGGLLPDADNRAVITSRSGETRTVDLQALLSPGGAAPDVEVRDGDGIFVAAAGRFYITGEVRRPGDYRLEEGTTTLRAITLAGGYTERAVVDRLKVIRSENGQETVSEIGTDAPFTLRRGDIVVVSAVRSEVCYLTGEVKNAGAFRCDPGTNVLKAVALAGGFTDAAAKNKIRIVRRVQGQEQVRDKVGLEEPVLPDDIVVVPKSFF